MGVLTDYFRAADALSVTRLMELAGGGLIAREGNDLAVDVVELKGVDPAVTLGALVAFALDVPWDVDLVKTTVVWPAETDAGADYEGPWVIEIDDPTRDALADIPDPQVQNLAARWVQIEELSGHGDPPPDAMVPVLTALIALARRAREVHDHLYCWICV